MKDFVKIFLVLIALVGAFVYGRQYGVENFKQSEEYQIFIKAKDEQAFNKSDLENAKAKFQNILDTAGTKKSEELLAQILQIFLADLGLRTQDQKSFVKETASAAAPVLTTKQEVPRAAATAVKKVRVYDYGKLKSYEWILRNSRDEHELRSHLKNIEIRDIDTFMKSAIELKQRQLEPLFGSYRGRIMDVTQKEYGTLSMDLQLVDTKLRGSIKIFKNGRETSVRTFETTQMGYQVEGSNAFIIDNGSTFYQLYKLPDTQQVAGYYYERMVNGTTKTIGSFILNRVDQF